MHVLQIKNKKIKKNRKKGLQLTWKLMNKKYVGA